MAQRAKPPPVGASEPTTAPRLYTPAEAAEILTIKESWLRRQAGQRTIPCTFIGKHLRFSDADLVAITRNGQRPARTSRRRSTNPKQATLSTAGNSQGEGIVG